MNRLVHLIVFILISVPLLAQISIKVEPTNFYLTGNPSESDVNYHVQVTNQSAFEIGVDWDRTVNNPPVGWSTWICDKNLCYVPFANANAPDKPNILNPGEHMDFQIHLNPYAIEGCTTYDINFRDHSDTSNILGQVHGEICITSAVGTNDNNSSTKSTVFPNPTTDYFQVGDLAGLRSIELFNIVGKKIRSFDAAPEKQYYVGDLVDGIYLVRMLSSTKKVLKTIRLSKR